MTSHYRTSSTPHALSVPPLGLASPIDPPRHSRQSAQKTEAEPAARICSLHSCSTLLLTSLPFKGDDVRRISSTHPYALVASVVCTLLPSNPTRRVSLLRFVDRPTSTLHCTAVREPSHGPAKQAATTLLAPFRMDAPSELHFVASPRLSSSLCLRVIPTAGRGRG